MKLWHISLIAAFMVVTVSSADAQYKPCQLGSGPPFPKDPNDLLEPDGLRQQFGAHASWRASAVKHPSPEIAKHYRYVLGRYFEEFDNVGLDICPGETLGDAGHRHLADLDWTLGRFKKIIGAKKMVLT